MKAPMIDPMMPTGWEAVNARSVVLDQILQESADEGADDTENDGTENSDEVPAGKEQARDQSGN